MTRRYGVYMSISREIVRECGANAAIVHQQVGWWIEHEDEHGPPKGEDRHAAGWFTGKSERLAEITGLKPDQVRLAMAKLLEAGLMEKRKIRAARTDHTCSYRPVDPWERADPDLGKNPNRSGDSPESRSGDSPESSMSSEISESTPLPPLEGGDVEPELSAPGQAALFGPAGGGASTRAEKKARAGSATDIRVKGAYASWAERYPKGNRGSRPAGERALAKAFRAGASLAEIDEQTARYAAARRAYHEAWAHVGNFWPSLMNASTFLNGKRELFDREWTREDLRYWPAPAGWSWDDLVTCHDAAGADDVPADVRAEGGLAVAMWRAKHRDAGAVAGG